MRVYYEPSLSYAQLSSNNIERLIGSDRKEALKVSEQENDDPNLQVKWMFSFHLNAAESQCSDIYLFWQAKYYKALETSQRSVPKKYQRDIHDIKQLMDLQTQIQQAMNASLDLVYDGPKAETLSKRSKSLLFTWPLFEVW